MTMEPLTVIPAVQFFCPNMAQSLSQYHVDMKSFEKTRHISGKF